MTCVKCSSWIKQDLIFWSKHRNIKNKKQAVVGSNRRSSYIFEPVYVRMTVNTSISYAVIH